MAFVNLTPHVINVVLESGETFTFLPSGKVARVSTSEVAVAPINGVPCVVRTLGSVDIPELKDDEQGIVSTMVLDAAVAQNHPMLSRLFVPDSGPTAVREGGLVKAVRRFVRV